MVGYQTMLTIAKVVAHDKNSLSDGLWPRHYSFGAWQYGLWPWLCGLWFLGIWHPSFCNVGYGLCIFSANLTT